MLTVISVPLRIKQNFNKYLLMDALDRYLYRFKELENLAARKLRAQDVGRLRDFAELQVRYMEVYERKKVEKAEYEAKVKEASKKRRYIPNTRATAQFRRF